MSAAAIEYNPIDQIRLDSTSLRPQAADRSASPYGIKIGMRGD